MTKYTKEVLAEAAVNSQSVRDVMRYLGLRCDGGNSTYMSKRLRDFEIDTSHFTGQAHGRGKKALNRLTPDDVLVELPMGSARPKAYQLRRGLIESGVPVQCICGLTDTWNGASIALEVDHIDGDWLNNKLNNLRFLCPNCHSQQDKNKSWKKQAPVA